MSCRLYLVSPPDLGADDLDAFAAALAEGTIRPEVDPTDAPQEPARRARELVLDGLGMDLAVKEPDASMGLVCSSSADATACDWALFGKWFLQDGQWDGE